MNRVGIDGPNFAPLPQIEKGAPADEAQGPSFAETLEEAVGNVRATMHDADKTAADALVGGAPPHQAMIAMAKADLQFRLFTQTRNKLVNAYNELMNLRM